MSSTRLSTPKSVNAVILRLRARDPGHAVRRLNANGSVEEPVDVFAEVACARAMRQTG